MNLFNSHQNKSSVSRIRRAVAQGTDRVHAVNEGIRSGAGYSEMREALRDLDTRIGGCGPLISPLLSDPRVTDILINSTQVWIDAGSGLQRVDLDIGTESDVRSLAVQMAASCGRRLDEASPIVDGTLRSGVRLHAVLPPLSSRGPLISLRTAKAHTLSIIDMVEASVMETSVASILVQLVKCRANVLISGSTGSGKTTLLASLLALVPPDQRIICIEEVSELRPGHPHVVHLQERRPNVQGVGAVELSDLVRTAMRMRPDRLILGECRGAEVRDVLTALNTGHEGGMATIHANAVEDVPARLAALGSLAAMTDEAVAAQAVAAFDAVIQLRRTPSDQLCKGYRGDSGGRYISQIGVFTRSQGQLTSQSCVEIADDGHVELLPAWSFLSSRFDLPGDLPTLRAKAQAILDSAEIE